MGAHTDIQWADSTVNPTTGCDGCELWHKTKKGPCYAGALHEGRLAKSLPALYSPDFTNVHLAPGRMSKAAAWSDLTGTDRPDKPWLNGLPRAIFVGDMGDLFSQGVPFEYIRDEVVATAVNEKGRRHIWMLLTKQPQRMAEFGRCLKAQGLAWPDNLWAGTSITKQSTFWRGHRLLEVPARHRFLSLEPLLENVDIHPLLYIGDEGGWEWAGAKRQMIELVIIGGESSQGGYPARPFGLHWARNLVNDCRRAGVAPFVKQLGSNPYYMVYNENSTTDPGDEVSVRLRDSHGGNPEEWAADLQGCREFPQPGVEAVR